MSTSNIRNGDQGHRPKVKTNGHFTTYMQARTDAHEGVSHYQNVRSISNTGKLPLQHNVNNVDDLYYQKPNIQSKCCLHCNRSSLND